MERALSLIWRPGLALAASQASGVEGVDTKVRPCAVTSSASCSGSTGNTQREPARMPALMGHGRGKFAEDIHTQLAFNRVIRFAAGAMQLQGPAEHAHHGRDLSV